LNIVLGCHEEAFALGPLDLRWKYITGEANGPACLIHEHDCDFWPGFQKIYSPDKNFFVELSSYSGKHYFVTNNLLEHGAGRHLNHPDIEVIPIHLVRDGRALAASYHRKFPDKHFIQAITEFLQPSFSLFQFETDPSSCLSLRYEDILNDQPGYLKRIGKFVGLDYDPSALRFWEWRHHLVFGNPGTIALVRMGEGLPPGDFVGVEFYRRQFDALSSGKNVAFIDNRHMQSLSRLDRYIFDKLAGADNERFGYQRDIFSAREVSEFRSQIIDILNNRQIPDTFVEKLLD